jgi:hypothetical protein
MGPDGHAKRGGFLPPVPLPRRMWAGGRLTWSQALKVGDAVQKRSRIASVKHKAGRTGDLIFVEVEHEVQVIQVGPVAFVSNPAEYFVQYGLDIKKGSPFPFTFPCELANGCAGYVPTEEAFGPHGGGYETRLTSYSNLEITAGKQFRDVGIELTQSMKPGPVPERAKAPFAGRAWSYGNVPPGVK